MYAVGYREGVLMRLTEDYKYKSVRKTGEVLAEMMDAAIPSLGGEIVVVPLPTIGKHIRERGFDHTLILAKKLARRRGWQCKALVERVNKTVQVGANEKVRKEQAKKAYAVVRQLDNRKTYLLLDDVWTTGASMEAAIEAVKKAGARKVASAVVLFPPE